MQNFQASSAQNPPQKATRKEFSTQEIAFKNNKQKEPTFLIGSLFFLLFIRFFAKIYLQITGFFRDLRRGRKYHLFYQRQKDLPKGSRETSPVALRYRTYIF